MPTDFTNAAGKDDDAGMALKLVCVELMAFCVACGLVYFTKNLGVGVIGFLLILFAPFAYVIFRDVRKEQAASRKGGSSPQES